MSPEVALERSSRLRRYQRKDYTQLVEFPVEIVGRDGQVRRYSFAESVRLYQRRIRSAPVRYDDPALVDAETDHCRQRIDQLRRSYVETEGWGGLVDAAGPVPGPLRADVVAFLHRAFPEDPAGRLVLTPVKGEGEEGWFVLDRGSARTFLLYAWRLDDPESRAACREAVARYAAMPEAPDVERLLVAAIGPDVGLLLTGSGPWDGPRGVLAGEDPTPAAPEADRFAAGLRALHDGNLGDAVDQFEVGLERSPGSRALAVGTAVVALLDHQAERGELAARQGLLAAPSDATLRYLLAVALGRQGRLREAAAVAEPAADRPALGVFLAVLRLAEGRPLRALGHLRRVRLGAGDVDRWLGRAHASARAGVLPGAIGLGLALISALAAGLAVAAGAPLGAALALAAAGVAAGSVQGGRAFARRLLAGERVNGARLVSLELLPRERALDQQ